MKKLLALMLVGILVAFAAPVLSSVEDPGTHCNVFFDVDVDKNVVKNEYRQVDKYLYLYVDAFIFVDEWAETEVVKCDLNEFNYADTFEVVNDDLIFESFNGFSGIAQVNQAAGSMNNQGNVVAVAVTNDAFSWALAHSQAAVEKVNYFNTHISYDDFLEDTIGFSFNGFSGIAQVNQAAGFMNNQDNAASVAANLGGNGLVAVSDAFLTMTNTDNNYFADFGNRTASIQNSFNGAAGIAQVNQGPGSMNNQANVVSISYSGYVGTFATNF
jgi:hypothetical protein